MDTSGGQLSLWGLLERYLPSNVWTLLAWFAIFAIVAITIVVIIRVLRGSSISAFGITLGERPKKNRELENRYKLLQDDFKSLNSMAKQTNIVIQLLNYLITELQSAMWDAKCDIIDGRKRQDKTRDLYELIFEAINTSLSTGKDQYHRVGVFIPSEDKYTLTLHRNKYKGFGGRAAQDLKLTIGTTRNPGSIAGRYFLFGEQVYSGNVEKEPSFSPNPKSTTKYSSVVCTPILSGSNCIGVLSIDGKEVEAFCEQDLRFMGVFAGMISLVMFWEDLTSHNSRADKEEIS